MNLGASLEVSKAKFPQSPLRLNSNKKLHELEIRKKYGSIGPADAPLPMMMPQDGFTGGGAYQEQALPRASRRLVAAG